MRGTAVLGLVAVVVLPLGAGGQLRADADPATVPGTFAATPAGVLDRLPPGARSGAERQDTGALRVEEDAPYGARWVEHLSGPSPGTDLSVEYTVDPDLDARVREILEQRRIALGHVILMNPATGELFAYVSTDPEAFPPDRPYPTASLMKVVTAAAALRHAPEATAQDCRYAGSPYALRASHLEVGGAVPGARSAPFWRALAVSNNQCFARLAVHDVGERALMAEMHRAGLLESAGPGHAPGRVEPVEDVLDLGRLGSGLAGSFVTPLAAARLAVLLARGERVEPWWVAGVRGADGRPRTVPGRRPPRRVWPAPVAEELRALMVTVTERGTARSAFHDRRGRPLLGSVRVAGKTGTLHGTDPSGLYRWFIGVAPADAPRLAIAVLVVDGTSSAADVAAHTLRAVFCPDGRCDASQARGLHARARVRDARAEAEWAGLRARARARPTATAAARRIAWRNASELDRRPRPVGATRFDFPPRLRRGKVRGEIVVLLDLSPDGEVLDARVDSSDLPGFEDYVLREVRSWRFTPPTSGGRPVATRARLPIAIRVN